MVAAAFDVDLRGLLGRLSVSRERAEEIVNEEIEQALDEMIAWIRSNDSRLFDNPTGTLTGGLYRGEAVGGRCEGGWSGPAAVYGPVLEHGPDADEWEIRPKGLRSDGEPVRALRWSDTASGEVRYARKVTHRWALGQLRPHWRDAVEVVKPMMKLRLARRLIGG